MWSDPFVHVPPAKYQAIWVPSARYQVPSTRCQVPGTRYRVLGTRFQGPGARLSEDERLISSRVAGPENPKKMGAFCDEKDQVRAATGFFDQIIISKSFHRRVKAKLLKLFLNFCGKMSKCFWSERQKQNWPFPSLQPKNTLPLTGALDFCQVFNECKPEKRVLLICWWIKSQKIHRKYSEQQMNTLLVYFHTRWHYYDMICLYPWLCPFSCSVVASIYIWIFKRHLRHCHNHHCRG